MHRSRPSIANLAAALAKAQAELVNPEKSLVATIRPDGPGVSERSFRHTPLSSGLDIVRKTLGRHEIATMQTTAIDQAAGHSSRASPPTMRRIAQLSLPTCKTCWVTWRSTIS
jgi:hypothetical protein